MIIAEHACRKYSGRVGRSSAAKALDEEAVRLAVTAHVRHAETPYDELLRIQTEEEVQIAEENKNRQVLVAAKDRERTDVVETQRVDKDRLLEEIEKQRIVELARIEKEKALEEEKKNIQEVIRDRLVVEKGVVEEQEKINDTRAFAEAQRLKEVAIVTAQKAAEAAKEASNLKAEQQIIEAQADQQSAEKKAEAMKTIAEARAAEEATLGLSEASVMEAKAQAIEKQGTAEAVVLEKKAAPRHEVSKPRPKPLRKRGRLKHR